MLFKKIIIINPFGIGDVLFTTPVIKALKQKYPQSFIGYWCNQRVEEILRNNPMIDRTFALSRGDFKKICQKSKVQGIGNFLKLLLKIKRENFDLSLDYSLDHRYSLLAFFLGIRTRIGLNYKNRGRFLTQKIDIDGFQDKHVTEYYLDILKIFHGVLQDNYRIEVFPSPKAKVWADDFLKKHNILGSDLLIGLCPAGGQSWGRDAWYLRWPSEKFAQLASILVEKYKARIIVFGAPEEIEVCQEIVDNLKDKVTSTAGKVTLEQFVGLLSKCKIAICNDTGPLHIAVGLGLKTVCICGPVDERVYGPYPINSDNIVIKKKLTCRPCYQHFRFPGCAHDHVCLRSIGVEEVLAGVERLIA